MLAAHIKVSGGAQFSVADDPPLMVMGIVEPELVSLAEPVTVQLEDMFNAPLADSVMVLEVAVKVMLPAVIIVDMKLQVCEKVKSIV